MMAEESLSLLSSVTTVEVILTLKTKDTVNIGLAGEVCIQRSSCTRDTKVFQLLSQQGSN